jgi:hypothetical protein
MNLKICKILREVIYGHPKTENLFQDNLKSGANINFGNLKSSIF